MAPEAEARALTANKDACVKERNWPSISPVSPTGVQKVQKDFFFPPENIYNASPLLHVICLSSAGIAQQEAQGHS